MKGVSRKKDGRYQVNYRDKGKVRSKNFPPTPDGLKKAKAFYHEIQALKAEDRELPVPRLATDAGIYFDELAQLWLDEKKAQGRATQWLKDLATILKINFIPVLANTPAKDITQADILSIITAHYVNHAQSTRNRYIGYVKAILQYGVDQGHLEDNPLKRWKKGKEQPRRTKLTLGDLQAIQRAAAPHLAWALEVAWNVPCRPGPSDLFALRFDEHVVYERQGLNVYHSKVKKWAFVPCAPGFMAALVEKEQEHASGYLIECQGRRIGWNMDSSLQSAAKAAKIPYSICFYDIRHLWITTMLDRGASAAAVAEMAGTSLRMIMSNYYEVNRAEKARAVGLLPSLGEQPRSVKVVNLDGKRK